jgi:L-threonylcarbamoyladenylate synthase
MNALDLYDDGSNLEGVASSAAEFLKEGKVLAYPTDTIYGLGADASFQKACLRIREIKGRKEKKPFSVIVRDLAMAEKYVFFDDFSRAVFRKFLPGKFTFILKSRKKLPLAVEGSKGTLALRIPDHFFTKKLSGFFSRPIITTSVNLSGELPLNWGTEIVDYFENHPPAPDLIVDAGRIGSEESPPKPSAVIDLSCDNPRIMRPGFLEGKKMLELLSELEALKNKK